MQSASPDFRQILRVLQAHEVEFILVGGLAGNLYGLTIPTGDIDIVHRRSTENIGRLLNALNELHAYYWEHTTRRLEPEARTLMLPGHHLLATDHGRIDVLGRIAPDLDYEKLLSQSVILTFSSGINVRTIDLPTLIEAKRHASRDKDKIAVPILERILQRTMKTDTNKAEDEDAE